MDELYEPQGYDHFRLGGLFNPDRLWSTNVLPIGQAVRYAEDIQYRIVRCERENDGYVYLLRLTPVAP